MDNNRKTMNKREIFMGHAYVFLFFFLTTVACCLVIFMWNSDFKMFEQKEFVKIKMNRIKDFQQEQAESQLPVDSLFRNPLYFYAGGLQETGKDGYRKDDAACQIACEPQIGFPYFCVVFRFHIE